MSQDTHSNHLDHSPNSDHCNHLDHSQHSPHSPHSDHSDHSEYFDQSDREQPYVPNRIEGIVREWHATKGRGRIEDDMTGEQYFVHWEDLCPVRNPPRIGWKPTLQTGESVQFTPGTNPAHGPHYGKPKAFEVTGAFSRPLMCDWITIPRCSFRGDPRGDHNDAYDSNLVITAYNYSRNTNASKRDNSFTTRD